MGHEVDGSILAQGKLRSSFSDNAGTPELIRTLKSTKHGVSAKPPMLNFWSASCMAFVPRTRVAVSPWWNL